MRRWTVKGMPKDFIELARIAQAQGWTVEMTDGNHVVWRPPDKTKPAVYSGLTSSDHRAIYKHRSLLKRSGLKI